MIDGRTQDRPLLTVLMVLAGGAFSVGFALGLIWLHSR